MRSGNGHPAKLKGVRLRRCASESRQEPLSSIAGTMITLASVVLPATLVVPTVAS
jgi:hypothetical protein